MKKHVASLVLTTLCIGCARSTVEEIPLDTAGWEAAAAVDVAPNDWPWWRGTERDNHAAGPASVLTWSDAEHVLWRTDVPGRGHASPTVCGGKIFVATADDDQETQSLLCYDQTDGERLWRREIHRGGFMHTHQKNSHASATPACDGQRVFTVFMVRDGIWVTAVDMNGKIAWQTQAGPFRSQHGYGSSPVVHESTVIVVGESRAGGFLAALHRETGRIVWRARRPSKPSYGTPVIADVAGQAQLLISGQGRVDSYDPATGEQLWSADGPAETIANTVACADQLVLAGGGYPEKGIMAIRADGGGQVQWRENWKVYVPSPLVVDNYLFIVQDNGVARCVDATTGEVFWTKRLGGDFSASPVLAGDHIFVPNERGTMFVLKASPEYNKVAENVLGLGGFASPVISDGRIYIRSSDELYCIGAAEEGRASAE